jgi:hypothetical protein
VQHSVTVQLPFVLSLWKQRLFNADIVTTFEKYKALVPLNVVEMDYQNQDNVHSSRRVCEALKQQGYV